MGSRTYSSERRAANAARTRSDVLRSALELFGNSGYMATTVPQIAGRANVAVPTVYSSVGGKAQVLVALLDEAGQDPVIHDAMRAVDAAKRPLDVVQAVAHGTRLMFERHGWLLGSLYDNAESDSSISKRVAEANRDQRDKFAIAAQRLHALGAAMEQSVESVTTVLLFHFAVVPWRSLRDEGWSPDDSERWLVRQVEQALID